MRIILIDAVDDSYGLQTKYHPLGLSYLVAYLPKAIKEKFEIKIINQDYFREIDDFKPQIVGISSVTQNFNKAKQIAAHAKKSGSFVLVGKSHITALPESLDDNMDVGIMGEGEETFLELLQLYLRGKTGPSDLNDIQGIVYRDTGRLAITRPRPFIANLDTIPFPDRSLFSLKPNDDFYMFTSRGCPYKCKFCFSSRFWHTTRFHSAEYVLEEIQEIYDKYRPLRITFSDDLFIADRKRLEEINERIKKRNYYRKIKFTISVRSNLVNEQSVKFIKGIGVDIVNMGLESGSQRILQFLKGENISLANHINAIALLKRKKLIVSASFIIGSPQETEEEILETYNFIKRSKLDNFEMNVLTPLPGTPIWDYALSRNLVSNRMDWDRLNLDFSRNPEKFILLSETVSREKISGFLEIFEKLKKRKKLFLKLKYLYLRPREILHHLASKISGS